MIAVVQASRNNEALALGASPRGTISLYRTAQALAAIRGRDYVQPDDVQYLIHPVLAHRLILSPESRLRGHTADEVLTEILDRIPVPVEESWSVQDRE